MPVQICLALELLGTRGSTNHCCTGVRIFAIRIVSLHVGLPVVASFEEFTTDSTFVGCLFWCSPLTLLLNAVDTR